jgi:DNA-binding MarR family transcriptional regulator
MTSDERHVLSVLGDLMTESRAFILDRGESGLRASHHRVIGNVPPEGITQTELADRVGMTKQGIGQFVNQLVDSGHLRVDARPGDRRVRLVHRTAKGDASVRGLAGLLDQLEETWAKRVGKARYREFRRTLEEIALS